MASKAAVAAALARMDTASRQTPPSSSLPETRCSPVEWRESRYSDRCMWCKSKTAMLVYSVRPIRIPARSYGIAGTVDRPAQRYSRLSAVCLDEAACKARRDKVYANRQARSGNLRWAMSRFERADLPKGSCRWCGEPIVFVEGTDYRVKRRERHRSDEHEVGDRNCRREHDRTFAATPRDLIYHRGDPCCVDCGDTGMRRQKNEDGSWGEWYESGEWEADHVIPVEDGGPHTPTNICRRCVRCHRAKTNAENRARAERRRVDKAQSAA